MPQNINNKPLTVKDVRKVLIPEMEKVFVTKKDAEQFATRKDLEQSATKEDLEAVRQDLKAFEQRARKNFATKRDLAAVRQDLADLEQRSLDVFATKQDLEEAVKHLSTKEDINDLLTAVDSYAKRADAYFQEMVMLSHKVDRHEKWIQQIAKKVGVSLHP